MVEKEIDFPSERRVRDLLKSRKFMNILTKETATSEQWAKIEHCSYVYVDTLRQLLEEIEQSNIPVGEVLKTVLGIGVSSGALGKFDSLKIDGNIITFDAWIKVIYDDSVPYHYLLHCWLNTETHDLKVTDE
jgi:hypothetical protein